MCGRNRTTPRQLEVITALMGKVDCPAIASILGISSAVVRYHHKAAGVVPKPVFDPTHRKQKPPRKKIDPVKQYRVEKAIKAKAGTMPRQKLADTLGITLSQLIYYAGKLGVSLEYFGYNPVTGKNRYTKDQVSKAKTLLNRGVRYSEILKQTGISDGSLWGILKGDTHKDVEPKLTFTPDEYNPDELRERYAQQKLKSGLDAIFN